MSPRLMVGESEEIMNEYYLVISTFYDNGRVKAVMHTESHGKRPENHSQETEDYDVYYDWLDKYEDALKFKNDCFKA